MCVTADVRRTFTCTLSLCRYWGDQILTLAPRPLSISDHTSPEHAPSSVLTSTKATTPRKALELPVEHIKAAIERSPSSVMDTSAPMMDDLGRCTEVRRVDAVKEVLTVLVVLGQSMTSAKTAGLGLAGADTACLAAVEAVLSLFTLSFARASLSPAKDLEVSAVKPSRLDVEAESDDRGRETGSDTDLGVGRTGSVVSISISMLVEADIGAVNDLGG